jgi:hypothetical protein
LQISVAIHATSRRLSIHRAVRIYTHESFQNTHTTIDCRELGIPSALLYINEPPQTPNRSLLSNTDIIRSCSTSGLPLIPGSCQGKRAVMRHYVWSVAPLSNPKHPARDTTVRAEFPTVASDTVLCSQIVAYLHSCLYVLRITQITGLLLCHACQSCIILDRLVKSDTYGPGLINSWEYTQTPTS